MSDYEKMENQTAAPKRRRFDIVIFLVIAAILAIYILELPGIAASHDTLAVPSDTLLITEILSSNSGTITTEDGMYCDWIELYNPSNRAINLAGFSITDDPKAPNKYVLPFYVLNPGEFAIVYADDMSSTGTELHVPFKLKNKGEMLLLFDTSGTEIQRVSFPALETNHSYAMDMDTGEWTATDKCTPGFPNTDDGYAVYQQNRRVFSSVRINEVMPGNTITLPDRDGDYSDWVELYNTSVETIDLTGWGLSDTEERPKRWVFPETTIGPGEYLIVFLSGKNRANPGEELHTDFRLNDYEDTLFLSNLHGQIVSEVHISKVKKDMTYALAPETGQWEVYSLPTPGHPNIIDGWIAYQESLYSDVYSPIIINEVMSNNTSTLQDQFGEYPDWIELYNRSDRDVNLSGWGLSDDTDELERWQFPSTVLSSGEHLIVYASGRDSTLSTDYLHTDFRISAEGDIVVLTDPSGRVADRCYVPPLRTDHSYQRSGRYFVFSNLPSPGSSNAPGYPGVASIPSFSLKAGMYDMPQEVELISDPDARIYYTLDGSTPTESSTPYTGPISVDKTTAIRAVSYRDGCLPSNAACATYLIGENIHLPVVSIVTDPANLFDHETGIYANGPGWTPEGIHLGANYWQDWERPAHMELLEPDGTVGISQDIGVKIFGGYSRVNGQKSFALMSRGQYGKRTFDYKVFPELPYTSYKDLVIRSAQDGYWSYIREKLQIDMVLGTADIDAQAHRQSILFVNGEFWGIYDLIEKINEHFLAQHHGVDPDKIDLLERSGDVILGSNEEYIELIEYVKTHDLSIPENYEYVASKVDISNYIDWCTIQIFIANNDFVQNTKFWKTQGPGGKWRWILFDLDWGYRNLYQDERSIKRLDFISKFLRTDFDIDMSLIQNLLKNKEFKQMFIKRYIYHYKVTFNPDKVLSRIDELVANIEPYIQRDREKWDKGPMDTWQQEIQLLKDFAVKRPAINLRYFQQYFGLSDAEMEELLSQQEAYHE